MMIRHRLALGAALLTLTVAGCGDWLSGPKLTTDPNRPVLAESEQLLVAVTAAQTTQFEGMLARIAAMWTQQVAGVGRQHKVYGVYDVSEGVVTSQFAQVYLGGGLIDLRKIQVATQASGDLRLNGIARVWEALVIGTAASIWGDIPYSEAGGTVATPRLDPQLQVYAAVQTVLDSAIAVLTRSTQNNTLASDLIFQGNRTKWIQTARTLKARFYLHVAEVSASNYALALTQAQLGISTPANDFLTYHSSAQTEANVWFQFDRERAGDIAAGAFLVNLLRARNDPRLTQYFAPNGAGQIVGAGPGGTGTNDPSNFSAARLDPSFPQPIVTWAETQLIIAEAAFQTGNVVLARSKLDEVRARFGLLPIGAGLSGSALLEAIITEKYIALFQNIEVWNDYKRTCFPRLTPAPGKSAIPGRLFYGLDERNTNPNVREPSAQPARNANDPNACP